MVLPSRGDVWTVMLDPTKGHEQGGTRPCLVLSVNKFNHGPADLTVVVPITSREKRIPSHVKVIKGEAGLTENSFVKCEEVRCVSKERLRDRWGVVQPPTMQAVETRVRVILGL
jgi:mRNA interferase MazF